MMAAPIALLCGNTSTANMTNPTIEAVRGTPAREEKDSLSEFTRLAATSFESIPGAEAEEVAPSSLPAEYSVEEF